MSQCQTDCPRALQSSRREHRRKIYASNLAVRDIGVYCVTGLRRGDAAKLGKQHIRNGVITIDTEKNDMRVTIPVLPELAEILEAGPLGELSIIASKKGQPIRKEVLGNLFKEACRAAGINKSAHGIRKAAATRAENNGATVATLEAIFGWQGGQMAALYTRLRRAAFFAAFEDANPAKRSGPSTLSLRSSYAGHASP